MQDRRFPRPVRPDQAQRLAATNAQIEVVQDLHLPVAGVEPVDPQMRLVFRKRVELLDAHLAGYFKRLAGDLFDRNDGTDAAVIAAA